MKNKYDTFSKEELTNQLEILLKDFQDKKFKSVFGKISNPKEIPEIRKNIARVKTVIRQYEIAEKSGIKKETKKEMKKVK